MSTLTITKPNSKRKITTMDNHITIQQVASAINIDPKSFMLIEELESVLSTQHEITSL